MNWLNFGESRYDSKQKKINKTNTRSCEGHSLRIYFFRFISPLLLAMQARQPKRKSFRPAVFVCDVPGCSKACTTARGLRQHHDTKHIIPAALLFPVNAPLSPSPSSDSQPNPNSPVPPSPTFSSRRSPRRTPTGSPIFVPRSPRPRISNGLRIKRHPLLDGASPNQLLCLKKLY